MHNFHVGVDTDADIDADTTSTQKIYLLSLLNFVDRLNMTVYLEAQTTGEVIWDSEAH